MRRNSRFSTIEEVVNAATKEVFKKGDFDIIHQIVTMVWHLEGERIPYEEREYAFPIFGKCSLKDLIKVRKMLFQAVIEKAKAESDTLTYAQKYRVLCTCYYLFQDKDVFEDNPNFGFVKAFLKATMKGISIEETEAVKLLEMLDKEIA